MRNKFLGTGQPGFHPIRKIRVALSGMRYAILYDLACRPTLSYMEYQQPPPFARSVGIA